MTDTTRYANAVALVTGAGSGIGAATATRLAAEGAYVLVTDIAKEAAERTVSLIESDGGRASAHELNVASRSDWETIADHAATAHAKIDLLVNNAGVTRDRSLERMTDAEWDQVIDVHLKGTWLGCQVMMPLLRNATSGAIVNITSTGRHGAFGQTNYSAAKAGIVGLTKAVALETARHGIRCNAVGPGAVNTPMLQDVPQNLREDFIQAIPLKRFAEPSEIAAAIAFLGSSDASYISGHVLDVNGMEPHA